MAAVASVSAIAAGTSGDSTDRLETTTSLTDGKAISYLSDDKPDNVERTKATGITNYEEDAKVGGGGAPEKVLIDNDVVRVDFVAFRKGFIRKGGVKRKNGQLLIYIDEGRYTITKSGAGKVVAQPVARHLARGSSVFHQRETLVDDSQIDEDYRVLFVEIKKKLGHERRR